MDGQSWQVLHVLSNREKRVAQHLEVRSVEYSLPLYSERVKWSDQSVVVERPLFSGCVFVRPLPGNRIPIISIPGVLRLSRDKEGHRVSCEELETIRNGLTNGLILRPHPSVVFGIKVRVISGAFAGVEGIVTKFRPTCRVVMVLSGIRQCYSVETELENLLILQDSRGIPELLLDLAKR